MQHNPTQLEYEALEPGTGPQFGVSSSPSTDFPTGSRYVVAWFTELSHATAFALQLEAGRARLAWLQLAWNVWDLETGELVQV